MELDLFAASLLPVEQPEAAVAAARVRRLPLPTFFAAQDTGALSDTLNGTGVRGTWGWFNPYDTGLVVSGFMQSKGSSAFGLNDPALIIDPTNRNFNDVLHLHAWFGLPLAGADTDGTSLDPNSKDGALIPFDMGVSVQFQSRIAGGNLDWYFNPIYDQEAFKVRPLGGVKYIRLPGSVHLRRFRQR